jgi:hypothetical protein
MDRMASRKGRCIPLILLHKKWYFVLLAGLTTLRHPAGHSVIVYDFHFSESPSELKAMVHSERVELPDRWLHSRPYPHYRDHIVVTEPFGH